MAPCPNIINISNAENLLMSSKIWFDNNLQTCKVQLVWLHQEMVKFPWLYLQLLTSHWAAPCFRYHPWDGQWSCWSPWRGPCSLPPPPHYGYAPWVLPASHWHAEWCRLLGCQSSGDGRRGRRSRHWWWYLCQPRAIEKWFKNFLLGMEHYCGQIFVLLRGGGGGLQPWWRHPC